MDRYHRVEKPREETPIKENEIRIMTQGRMRNYITYAINLIQEKGANEIVFKAMGRAINKTVMIVELIKRRVAGLHQITEVGSIDITDTWEPLEEGLLPLETKRHVSMITITLSKVELDKSNVGYQVPLPEDQVRPMVDFEYDEEGGPSAGRGRGRGGRRGRRGGRGMNSGMNGGMNGGVNGEVNGGTNGGMVEHNNEGGNDNRGQRGGGYTNGYVPRGRGGFRGRGRRGGYGGPRSDNQEGDGYFDDAPMPPQGRGRGRGRGPRGRGMGRRGRGGIDAPLGANGLNEAVTAE